MCRRYNFNPFLAENEKRIKNEPNEHSVPIDGTRNILLAPEKVGARHNVDLDFGVEPVEALKLDVIATHNHPRSHIIPFLAPMDLAGCLSEGATEMRAVSRFGKVHSVRFRDISIEERQQIAKCIKSTAGPFLYIFVFLALIIPSILVLLYVRWVIQYTRSPLVLGIPPFIGGISIAALILYSYFLFYIISIKILFWGRVIFGRCGLGERLEFKKT
jgi:hypothetical protein